MQTGLAVKTLCFIRVGDVVGLSRRLIISAFLLFLAAPVQAKHPGEYSCYRGLCWRVATVDQVGRSVGARFVAQASYYDAKERDRHVPSDYTSSGERFNPKSLDRVSSPNLPNGTKVLLWHPQTGVAAYVLVNDTGPFKGQRVIDVPIGLAKSMRFKKSGVTTLHVVVVSSPAEAEVKYLKKRNYPFKGGILGRFDSLEDAVAALPCPDPDIIRLRFEAAGDAVRPLTFGRIQRRGAARVVVSSAKATRKAGRPARRKAKRAHRRKIKRAHRRKVKRANRRKAKPAPRRKVVRKMVRRVKKVKRSWKKSHFRLYGGDDKR
jgi:hypothetical protein